MSFPYNIRIPLQKSKYKSDYKKRYKGVTESVEEEYTEFEKVDATVRPVISNSHRARKKRSMNYVLIRYGMKLMSVDVFRENTQ
ncbi:hypothetical protein TELCIR_11811 [Teladorsagia circumcincta]|uniref:Uncharacterized protein n=1 Tax=Teladorsagia circumcincta TaxID=45464 RepID=A0A2G9U8I1_TELCI|nr:hypothetical protein TELCIR_11811 [Teladorsagia circumcincta]